MEELSTLATGFEVDGGQLRFQLYIWLEKEVEVLRQLTNYGKDMEPLSRASSGRFCEQIIRGLVFYGPPDDSQRAI